jgi:hypothetical protein
MARNHSAVPVRRKSHDTTVIPVRRNIHDGDISFPNGTHEDGAVCSLCGARYHNHHWALPVAGTNRNGSSGAATGKASSGGHRVLCPACRKAEERDPGGIVRLSGDYWLQHRDEILNLIRNEEKKAMGINPVERILRIDEEDGHLVIQTTNEKLAQRLGRALHRACHGDVEYKWSNETKLVRVEWRR